MTFTRAGICLGVLVVVVSLFAFSLVTEKGWRWVLPRGEVAEVPEDFEEPVPPAARGVTVPPSDGSHEDLPEDKATDATFWNLAKTIGIEVDR